ncbi:MAG: DF family (seleno)protein [bacterium]
MRVELFYWEECPSHAQALVRLREVLSEEGIGSKVEVIRVDTEDQAQRLRFPGSPTIRFDGVDIAAPVDESYGLSCRVYLTDDGRVTPLPSKEMIRRALRNAVRTREV